MASVAAFSRHVIVQCGPPAGVPYNTAASFHNLLGGGALLYGTLLNWVPLKRVWSRD